MKVLVRKDCYWCKGSGKEKSTCGGDRYDMWECARGYCNKRHADETCTSCNGKGYKSEERELYEENPL